LWVISNVGDVASLIVDGKVDKDSTVLLDWVICPWIALCICTVRRTTQ
jgi:hypothetical protein